MTKRHQRIRYTWRAWAIHSGFVLPGAHPYVGQYETSRYWPGEHQRGFPVAAYQTRGAARTALRALRAKYRNSYKGARIVRVEIQATFEATP